MSFQCRAVAVQGQTHQQALRIFHAFDADHSGTLGIDEFRNLLQMLYGKRTLPSDDVEDFVALLQLSRTALDYETFVLVRFQAASAS